MLEMHIIGPIPDLLDQKRRLGPSDLWFKEGAFQVILVHFENHCSRVRDLAPGRRPGGTLGSTWTVESDLRGSEPCPEVWWLRWDSVISPLRVLLP